MATDRDDKHREPTLDDNPGLEHDEATAEGKMMTGTGSVGSVTETRREARRAADEREGNGGRERTRGEQTRGEQTT